MERLTYERNPFAAQRDLFMQCDGESSEATISGGSVIRMGRPVPADEVFEAWTSGDLDKMIAAFPKRTNPIDRHFLLQGIVQATYKRRSVQTMRQLCKKVGLKHIDEFKDIAPALKIDMGGTLPRVSTFQHLATVFTEDREYEVAIQVCESAIAFGISDGTKGGFHGRIAKIRRKQESEHRGRAT